MAWCTTAVIVFLAVLSINCESIGNAENNDNDLVICDKNCQLMLTKFHEQNRFIKLMCRDDATLVVKVQNEEEEISGASYMLTVSNRDKTKLPPKTVHLLKKQFAAITHLQPHTKYNISAALLNENYQYTVRQYFMEFETLEENYVPGSVANIYMMDMLKNTNGSGVDVFIVWDPNEDRTCSYKILLDADYDSYDSSVIEFDPEGLFDHELKQLEFDRKYAIAIQAYNLKNETLKSKIWWHFFTTPTCLELYKDNVSFCAPIHPENITVTFDLTTENLYTFNVSWQQPATFPDYYTLDIICPESGLRNFLTISNGTTNSVQLTDVEINGIDFQLFLTAHSSRGESSSTYYGRIELTDQPPIEDYFWLYVAAFISVPPIVAIFLIAIVVILNRDQEETPVKKANIYLHQELTKDSALKSSSGMSAVKNPECGNNKDENTITVMNSLSLNEVEAKLGHQVV